MRLAREFPNLIYVKEESFPLVPRMKEEVRHHDLLKGVFGASGGNGLLYEMRLGLDGEIGSLDVRRDLTQHRRKVISPMAIAQGHLPHGGVD